MPSGRHWSGVRNSRRQYSTPIGRTWPVGGDTIWQRPLDPIGPISTEAASRKHLANLKDRRGLLLGDGRSCH
jgi:hypothetical protein